jgi:pimeloyl-ACP methyl ester carboxylesterase
MSCLRPIALLSVTIYVILMTVSVGAIEVRAQEQTVEFHNQDVKLAGSLILPQSKGRFPAVVLVHGAGRQTRASYRQIGEHFANQGIAALIYDKRGVGQSSGSYESSEPYDNLVNDALAAVELLKSRKDIDPSQIGIFGLSQGAYISAAAAARSKDIKFVIVVGASVADGMMFYYRDNLFRKYGLSAALRDVAEKIDLIQRDLSQIFANGPQLSLFAARSYPAPDRYVHPAWHRVTQPVLAMWGQLDQHVPVGESVSGLKNSLEMADNGKWTMVIVPSTNHDLKVSNTGEIQSESYGYPPEELHRMTQWAWTAMKHPSELDNMKQEGIAPSASVLPKLASYETLRWYGNAMVQASLWILFLVSFSTSTIASTWSCLMRMFRGKRSDTSLATDKAVRLKRAICSLNFMILVAFSVIAYSVSDQIHPNCPYLLRFVPLLGSVSTFASVIFLIVLYHTPRESTWTLAKRIRWRIDVSVMLLFIPYMLYWNLIGFHF